MDQDTITSQRSYLDSEAKQYRSEKSVIASSQLYLRMVMATCMAANLRITGRNFSTTPGDQTMASICQS